MKIDDHKTVRRNLRAWLNELEQMAANRTMDDHRVANSVVMAGGIVVHSDPDGDIMSEYEAWYASHRKSHGTAVIRLLKRHRRWAAVKRILTANWDPFYMGPIITPEFHGDYLLWLNSAR